MNAQRKLDQQHDYQGQEEVTPKYQAYQAPNSQSSKLQELLFFTQITGFCIATIISCLILLSLSLQPLIAFPLSMMLSFGLLTGIKFYLYQRKKRN